MDKYKTKEFFVKYEIDTKTQYVIEDDKVVDVATFEFCPYVWFGSLREKIESGLVEYVMWKKLRFVKE